MEKPQRIQCTNARLVSGRSDGISGRDVYASQAKRQGSKASDISVKPGASPKLDWHLDSSGMPSLKDAGDADNDDDAQSIASSSATFSPVEEVKFESFWAPFSPFGAPFGHLLGTFWPPK